MRREDSRDIISSSPFESYKKDSSGKFIAIQAISTLLHNIQAEYVMLSYSSGGRATKEELMDSISAVGEIKKFISIDYRKNVMANMRWTNQWINSDTSNHEYLFF